MDKTLHIKLNEKDVGRYAIIPGNPDRCEKIASLMENSRKIQENREHTTYEGYLEGEKVIVTSTGMGGPSAAICIEELKKCGVDTFIRVGTCASTSEMVKLGTIVIPNGAVRMESTGLHYLPLEFPAIPDYKMLKIIEETSINKGFDTKVGITIIKDSYFTEINPLEKPFGYNLYNSWNSYEKGGAIATSMESATLFLIASCYGLRMATVLVSATNYNDESSIDTSENGYPKEVEYKACEVGVESIRNVIKSDKER